ncbi:MAG: chemotaxis protein CheW [Myxococcota bacterium]
MSEASREERLLTFEVAGAAFALPIADVLEVAEVEARYPVPSLPPTLAGVVNHHGDALPVVEPSVLFDLAGLELPPPAHLLVLGEVGGDAANLALPVDRICGLVPGRGGSTREPSGIVERRSLEGRVVSILDTNRLLARAAAAIEQAGARSSDNDQGGLA